MTIERVTDDETTTKRAAQLAAFTGFELLLADLEVATRCARTGCRPCSREARALQLAIDLKLAHHPHDKRVVSESEGCASSQRV